MGAAVWFAERELVGFANHFRDEAKQEQEHSAKFADYLISRGQTVELDTLEPPCQTWTGVEDVVAKVFLDGVIDEQRLSEHEAAYLLGRVKFAAGQPAALLIIDAELREEEAKPM